MIIKRQQSLKLILLGALINSSLFIAFRPEGFSPLRIFIALCMIISAFLLVLFFIRHIKKYVFSSNIYFKILFFLLFSWIVVTIFRAISLNEKDMISLFGHYLMGWAWVTPLAVVFGFNLYNWIHLFNFIGKLLLVGVLLTLLILFIPNLNVSYTFGIVEWVQFFPVLFFTYWIQKPFYKKVVILSVIAFIILSVYNSQRVSVLYIALIFLFMFFELFRTKYLGVYKKVFIGLLSILLLLVVVEKLYTTTNYIMNNDELTRDTRTFLKKEMFSDMSDAEQIIGRGALGTYYSPYFASLKRAGIEGGDSSTRTVNEIGYLEMILKGGYIMMILYLLILLPASYLGIFKSKNIISRMSGYIIAIYLIVWLVSYYSVYSAEYLLLWMAVGTAISPRARKISDDEIVKYIKTI